MFRKMHKHLKSSFRVKSMSLYWHTLRYLRPVQLYGRLRNLLPRPRPNLKSTPLFRSKSDNWVCPALREPSLTGPRDFLFLNERGCLDDLGWDSLKREKLWRYNQHYFDDLNAKDSNRRTAWHQLLLHDWVSQNLPGHGIGWDPYPTSLRIVNWIKWSLIGNKLSDECIESLAVQAQWLEKRFEVHLLGNHVFANAKALVFAGLFFEGLEAERWLRIGLHVLGREVPEQIQPDGGHFERSTMYDALALEEMLDLCNIGACYSESLSNERREQLAGWRLRIPKMVDWLHTMCHPDGEISFFNDAAMGIAPSVAELTAYAARLGFSTRTATVPERSSAPNPDSTSFVRILRLHESGYVRLASQDAVALLDVAPVGPDYLAGHAHADTLSFELSVFGQRLLVNSGTSCYGISPERLRQRGTAAHNTVVVDGRDSSEVWGGFRMARRAHPVGLIIGPAETLPLEVRCAHDGYRRLAGRVTHSRQWRMWGHELSIEDRVLGAFETAEARFHLHPEVCVTIDHEGDRGEISLPGNHRVAWWAEVGSARLAPSTYHPQFGVSRVNQCLVLCLTGGMARLRLRWFQSRDK